MKPEPRAEEDALLQAACRNMPTCDESPAFASRVMASVGVTAQDSSPTSLGLPGLGRWELLGGLTGLLAGLVLVFLATANLNSAGRNLSSASHDDPLTISALETPLEPLFQGLSSESVTDEGSP